MFGQPEPLEKKVKKVFREEGRREEGRAGGKVERREEKGKQWGKADARSRKREGK